MLPEAPSLALIELLLEAGAQISTHDPVAHSPSTTPARRLARLAWCHDPLAALEVADALVLATAWHAFRKIPPQAIARALRDRLVLDGRNVLRGDASAGLTLMQVGRPALPARQSVAEPWPRSGLHAAVGLPA